MKHEFVGDVPASYNSDTLPATKKYYIDDEVEVDKTQYITQETVCNDKDIKYTFDGWIVFGESGQIDVVDNKFNMSAEDVTVKGTWTMEHIDDISYEYKKGNNSVYYRSNKDLQFIVERSYNDKRTFDLFDHLTINNGDITISEDDYDKSSGSLKHTLKASFLENLDTGEYTLTAYFKDNLSASTKFKASKRSYSIPKTAVE